MPKARVAPIAVAALDAVRALLLEAPRAPYAQLTRDVMRALARGLAASRGLCDPLAAQGVLRTLGDPSRLDGLEVEALGAVYEHLLSYGLASDGRSLVPAETRRRAGSHYTSRELAREVVTRALAPLWEGGGRDPLSLRVCDPAMGCGAFLLEAMRQLSARAGGARGAVARGCLFGVDLDPTAVEIARASLAIEAGIALDEPALTEALREGDALLGSAPGQPARLAGGVSWDESFSLGDKGFDVIVGNPPWVSYAGRAAQPLDPARRAHYSKHYRAFKGYKNLQGLFIERITALGGAGTRVGVVLPSSMAELSGYAATRAVFDRAARCDPSLPDLGERSFLRVDQPAMALLGTLREAPLPEGSSAPWPIERPDLDDEARGILARMEGAPFSPETFGERGLQTQRDEALHLRAAPDGSHTLPLREGRDVTPFRLGSPSRWADPSRLAKPVRGPDAWARVDVVIRQTARVPIAARSDGGAFRNTLLAGFGSAEFSAGLLLAWLNSAAVRWRHYHLHRDARLGMPQVKVAHLRAITAPPAPLRAALDALGSRLGARNTGVSAAEQRELDTLSFEAFSLSVGERQRVLRDLVRVGAHGPGAPRGG